MSAERWRMLSGRIATIDLQQAPEAIEGARRLLREFGDAELINEEAPGAGGNQPEGEDQNPCERNQFMMQSTHLVDQAEGSEIETYSFPSVVRDDQQHEICRVNDGPWQVAPVQCFRDRDLTVKEAEVYAGELVEVARFARSLNDDQRARKAGAAR